MAFYSVEKMQSTSKYKSLSKHNKVKFGYNSTERFQQYDIIDAVPELLQNHSNYSLKPHRLVIPVYL